LAELISDADYPDAAIRAGAQGRVAFALDVAVDGHVTACAIVASSGSPILDQTTCQIMIYRAQFVPAHDAKGRPTTDRVHAAVRWVLPKPEETTGLASRAKANLAELVNDADYPDEAIRAGAQGMVGFSLDIAADGHVTACAIETSSGSPILDGTTCQIMTARAQFVPARDLKGRPTTDRVHARVRWVLPQMQEEEGNGAPSEPSIAPQTGA
jgi:TonB family protein